MKRRNFLKAIGLGAVIAPAVVMAKPKEPRFKHEKYSLPIRTGDHSADAFSYFASQSRQNFDKAIHRYYVSHNAFAGAMPKGVKIKLIE